MDRHSRTALPISASAGKRRSTTCQRRSEARSRRPARRPCDMRRQCPGPTRLNAIAAPAGRSQEIAAILLPQAPNRAAHQHTLLVQGTPIQIAKASGLSRWSMAAQAGGLHTCYSPAAKSCEFDRRSGGLPKKDGSGAGTNGMVCAPTHAPPHLQKDFRPSRFRGACKAPTNANAAPKGGARAFDNAEYFGCGGRI